MNNNANKAVDSTTTRPHVGRLRTRRAVGQF